ncbi:MAG: hypothetical protein JWP22_3643 [Ramlibacter sp.]|nr:hypothetical protein [Ramlibacter sp.]
MSATAVHVSHFQQAQPAGIPTGKLPFDAGAWRQEWQRAQTRAWFYGPLSSGGAEIHKEASDDARPEPAVAPSMSPAAPAQFAWSLPVSSSEPAAAMAMPKEPEDQPLRPASAWGAAAQPRLSSAFAFASLPPALLTPALPGESSATHPAPRESREVPQTRCAAFRADSAPVARREPATRPAQAMASGVRLHIEQGPDGAVVWLGIDGDAAAIALRAAAICADLRRNLSGTQQGLALVVCNGRAIYSLNAPLRKETS